MNRLLCALTLVLVVFLSAGVITYYKKPVIERPPATGKMPSDIVGKTFACSNGFIAASQ